MTALLEVKNLVKQFVAERSAFGRPTAFVKAVDGVSFALTPARRWRWSANPAAANPPSAGWYCA